MISGYQETHKCRLLTLDSLINLHKYVLMLTEIKELKIENTE